jgi:hypothetical protein
VASGLPETSWDEGGFRFSGAVTRVTWKIRFHYLKMRGWRDAPRASDVLQTSSYSEVELCDKCWGDVLNFIVTTKPE